MFLYGILCMHTYMKGRKIRLKYKLIALDMDGTLLNSDNQVSTRTKEAILKANDKGAHVVLATGRILTSAIKYASKIDLKRPIISSNGAIIIDENEDIIYKKEIDNYAIEAIAELADRNNLYYHFYTEDSFYSNQYVRDIVEFYNPIGVKDEEKVQFNLYKDIKDIIDKKINIYKFIFIDNDREKLYKLRGELKEIDNINISSSWFNNIEIMEKKVSKGNSLKFLCDRLNIPRESVIAVGDNENDISMIDFAGLGVAMENANEKAKTRADIITSTNDKDGVAEIIEKYIL